MLRKIPETAFLTTIRFDGNETTISIEGECTLGSVGVSPVMFWALTQRKPAGATPALLEPGPQPLFCCGITAERSFVRNAGQVFVSFGNRKEITISARKEFETVRSVTVTHPLLAAGHRLALPINPCRISNNPGVGGLLHRLP